MEKTHKYSQHFYEHIEGYYEKGRAAISKHQEPAEVEGENTAEKEASGSAQNTEQEDFVVRTVPQTLQQRKLALRIRRLEKTLSDLNEMTLGEPKQFYELKIKEISEQWKTIEQLEEELYEHDEDQEKQQKTLIRLYKEKEKVEQNQESRGGTQNLQLPRINIPAFDGNIKTWQSFYGIFERVIENNSRITQTEEMHYLKTSVRGEAANVIQHLSTCGANYADAWELLRSRFNNKRVLFANLVDTILNLQPLTVE